MVNLNGGTLLHLQCSFHFAPPAVFLPTWEVILLALVLAMRDPLLVVDFTIHLIYFPHSWLHLSLHTYSDCIFQSHNILEPTTGVTLFNSGFKSDTTELFPSIV
jgi:hypothetical protein